VDRLRCKEVKFVDGAIAEAVSCRFPTAAAWVRYQVRSCGIYGRRSGTRTGLVMRKLCLSYLEKVSIVMEIESIKETQIHFRISALIPLTYVS
jgi:hypothetical protein